MKFLARFAGGLAVALTFGTPASAACVLTKVSEMPMTELGHHYAIMAKINDVVRPMIVDTGAEATMLTASFAEEIKLAPDNSLPDLRPVLGIGQTQFEWHLNVIPSVLGFGDLIYRDRSTVVAAMDEGQLPERASVGLLGADILSQFDAEFDFPANKLTLYRTSDCFSAFAPWTGSYSAIPFEHRRAMVVIDVFFDEEQTRAMVDTGNGISFISRNAAVLADAPDAAFSDPVGTSRSPLTAARRVRSACSRSIRCESATRYFRADSISSTTSIFLTAPPTSAWTIGGRARSGSPTPTIGCSFPTSRLQTNSPIPSKRRSRAR
jgi:hypothetical protein